MKALSIIGIILFGFILLGTFGILADIEESLETLESMAQIASYFDAKDSLQEFADNVWGIAAAAILCSLYGLALSIVGCVVSSKKVSKN